MPGLHPVTALVLSFVVVALSQFELRECSLTIPESIAKGAVASSSSIPSGLPPAIADVLYETDVLVMGTIGTPRSYLSDSQCAVYTDYPLNEAVVLFTSEAAIARDVTVTQLGGTIVVNGKTFTQHEPTLPPLPSGTTGLFMLQSLNGKYRITWQYYGAFAIRAGRVVPLTTAQGFASEYVEMPASRAIESFRSIMRVRRKPK